MSAAADRVMVELEDGWADAAGRRHRRATLRPARVRDELKALSDFRVWLRPEGLSGVLLSRVVEAIGPLEKVDVGVIESLSSVDRDRLAAAYARMNGYDDRGAESGAAEREETT